jgi:hypothetical protein
MCVCRGCLGSGVFCCWFTWSPPLPANTHDTHTAPSDAFAVADDHGAGDQQQRKQQEEEEEQYEATVEELRAFLQTHIDDLRLHPPTTYELLASHGRKQV